jgi:Lon protease-like protein
MSRILPLFPLKLVVYPGEDLNLHIFEPRYKQLINECDGKGITFGIPAFINKEVQPTGTEIELVAIDQRYPNGEMDIHTRGTGLFKILTFFRTLENRLYAGGEIEPVAFDRKADFTKNEEILHHLGELYKILQIKKPLPENTPGFHTFDIAHLVGFNLEQEYELLSIPVERDRQTYMLDHLEHLLPMAREMEELRKKVQMNGHFKNILPPEFQ